MWKKATNTDLVTRRSNFHGLQLKAMTDSSGTTMALKDNYITEAKFYSNNDTFFVNGYAYGIFNDVLQILQNQLNFTTQLYKRKDGQFGYIYKQLNGSFKGTGMVGDIFFKRADFVAGKLNLLQKVTLIFLAATILFIKAHII